MNNEISSGEHQCRQFSLDEMERSTNNFDPHLWRIWYSIKGNIDGGETTLAVKRLKPGSSQGEKELWTEINMLSMHHHENLLSLIGYCIEGHEMLLVYDYMPRGSLADNRYKMDRNSSSLSWERRLKISIGVARGLDFLHTCQNRVIHRDIKISNILLDENWEISDFGLSKMGPGNESATHVSKQVKGTFRYLDPEYFLTNRLTWKTDVYAFGVVTTRKFSNDTVLGEGGFGRVYKGYLSEVSILGRFSHPNLIKLLGYCQEDEVLLLVYEFIPKGSLSNHLYGSHSAAFSLPWIVRVQIVIDTGRGLAFLHASEKQVINRNFSASNILLDGSYNEKIADFGFAKQGTSASQSHVTTWVIGTYGYAAPKTLVLEEQCLFFWCLFSGILKGLRALDNNRPSNQINLTDWIKPHLSDRRKLKDRTDSRLGGKYPSRDAVQIAQLELLCLGNEPKSRLSMEEVVKKLEQIEVTNERSKDHVSSNTRSRAYPLVRRAE
uniref:Protein kinase domain-containing protein n=1 Tax=Solanum lycopersicum TaxID=4081 RepID=A0A3Q7EVJ8_SOLLC